ncbi:MAG: DNA polymerase [Candidatus Tectimicrobiota bacterium]|nr:MAG: DNA polymerase [Candidatus Tectomicrobia bacterium]
MPVPATAAATGEDPVLYGHDPAPRLVALHPLRQEAEQAAMRLYWRDAPGGGLRTEDVPFYPFFFLADLRLLEGFPRQRFRCQRLRGDNYYRYLVVFTSWQAYREAVRHVAQAAGSGTQRPSQLYLIASPAQQYLMQSGRTLFKGMTFDDLHRLQLDIEVLTTGSFPQAERPEDRIVVIALADNRGWQHLIDGRTLSEREMLEALVALVRDRDPDVIEGHNIYAFDFPYLMARCQRHGVPFAIGRDGSLPRTFAASVRFAERTVDFPALEIAGRHVIDTYFQVLAFDVYKRDLPDYSLKTAARYFGLAAPERTYVEGAEVARVWRTQPERLLAYARDDVLETERLARHLSASTFYLTQMLPMPYGQVARTGPAAKIEALFVREYLRQRHALPRNQLGVQKLGGYTDVFVTGIVGPVVYADVESLYPSIMLQHQVRPRTDTLGLFQTLLRRLTELRLATKHRMRTAATSEERSRLDAQQSSYKILINSFYGMLGFSMALFNDFEEADRVAATGQQILRHLIALIRREGGTVVEVDTDGVFFVPPPGVRGEDAERVFLECLNAEMPAGIRLGFEGRFCKMLSYKKKNYALLGYDGTLHYKGSSLVSRAIERFGRQFVLEAIALLLREDIEGLHRLYLATRERILRHDWTVADFARTETLKESAEDYQAAVAAGRRSRAAAYELAIARARETGQPVRKGDRIAYYIAGSGATVTAFENARLAEAWDPAHPDENTDYYLRRLEEFARKFQPFFSPEDFHRVFGPEGLFGFSAQGMRLRTTVHPAAPLPRGG